MDTKLKLRANNDPLRQGDAQLSMALALPPVAHSSRMSLVDQSRIRRQVKKANAEVADQAIRDWTEAVKHTHRLQIQAAADIEGQRIALGAAKRGQSLSAECTRVTADGVAQLEDERYTRTLGHVQQKSRAESELDSCLAAGELSADDVDFLKKELLEGTQMKIDSDKALTRMTAAHCQRFSQIAITGFNASSAGKEE